MIDNLRSVMFLIRPGKTLRQVFSQRGSRHHSRSSPEVGVLRDSGFPVGRPVVSHERLLFQGSGTPRFGSVTSDITHGHFLTRNVTFRVSSQVLEDTSSSPTSLLFVICVHSVRLFHVPKLETESGVKVPVKFSVNHLLYYYEDRSLSVTTDVDHLVLTFLHLSPSLQILYLITLENQLNYTHTPYHTYTYHTHIHAHTHHTHYT